MTTATLTKWGNSQGLVIPKAIRDSFGWKLGDKIEFTVVAGKHVELKKADEPDRGYHRTRVMNADDVFKDWNGPYEPPTDWPTVGNEVDWGEPVGAEVW